MSLPAPLADELVSQGLAARPVVRGPDSGAVALVLDTLNTASSLVTLAIAAPALKRAAQSFMPWLRGERSEVQSVPGTIHVATANGYQAISVPDLDHMVQILIDQAHGDTSGDSEKPEQSG